MSDKSDLFGNYIVGFNTRQLMYSNLTLSISKGVLIAKKDVTAVDCCRFRNLIVSTK